MIREARGEIAFRHVKRYRCCICRRLVNLLPCPRCVAVEAAGPAVVADSLLLAVARRAERQIDQAGKGTPEDD